MAEQPLKEPLEEPLADRDILLLGQEVLQLDGDYSRLVTFLNQCLKERGLIFGLTRRDDENLCLRIYEVTENS